MLLKDQSPGNKRTCLLPGDCLSVKLLLALLFLFNQEIEESVSFD